jgi:hypothetical protein
VDPEVNVSKQGKVSRRPQTVRHAPCIGPAHFPNPDSYPICHQTLSYHLPHLTPPSRLLSFPASFPHPFLDAFDSPHHSPASVFTSSSTLRPRGRFLTSVVFAFDSGHTGLSNLPLCCFSYPHQCTVYSLDEGIFKPLSGKSTTSTLLLAHLSSGKPSRSLRAHDPSRLPSALHSDSQQLRCLVTPPP